MQDNYTSKGKHLTESERLLIERWHNKEKISNREIAYCLGKAPQTIHNEIQRGTVQLVLLQSFPKEYRSPSLTF